MNKNFIRTIVICQVFLSTILCSNAVTVVEVETMTPFSTINPSEKMKVITRERVEFDNGIVWEDGTIVTGQILDVKQPKRGKLDASFKFHPQSATYKGKTSTILEDGFIGKYSATKEIDKAKIAASAATTAGGLVLQIPFFSQGVSFVKGFVKNPEKNRFKSGAVQVYKDSPVSYIEEGKDIILNKDDVFYLKFKTDDNTDYENMDHTVETDGYQDETNVKNVSNLVSEPPRTIYIDSPEEVLREVENAR